MKTTQIELFRIKARFSRSHLAALTKLSETFLEQVEMGHQHLSQDQATRCANALGLSGDRRKSFLGSLYHSFGELLASHRNQQGLGQDILAQRSGARSRTAISLVETNQRPPPLKHLKKWADALGLRDDERKRFLFEGELENAPGPVKRKFRDLEAELENAQCLLKEEEHEKRRLSRALEERAPETIRVPAFSLNWTPQAWDWYCQPSNEPPRVVSVRP